MTPPIIPAALGAAVGAALALRTPAVPSAWLLLAAGCVSGAALCAYRTRAFVLASFLAAGGALGLDARTHAAADCRTSLRDGDHVSAEGVFLTLPDSGARALLHAVGLESGGVIRCRDVVIRVDLRAPLNHTAVGFRLEGEWRRWDGDAVQRPERSGVLRVRRAQPVEVAYDPPMRTRLQLAAQARTRALYGADAPLVEALLLARTETLPRDVRTRFAESGLVHLLAISGTHVALILGVLLVLASALRLRPTVARPCALAGVVAYVLFLGAPAPAVRAALQIALFSVGRALQRPSDALSAVAVAALILIGIDPFVVLDAGAQLSFAGVGGIIAFAPACERGLGRVPRLLARPLAAGLAASATTLPLAGLHFGTLAPIGVLAGVPGVPLTGIAVPASALPLVLAPVAEPLAHFLVPSGRLFVLLLDRIALIAAAVPGGHSATEPVRVQMLLISAAVAIMALRICAGHLSGGGMPMPQRAVVISAAAAAAAFSFALAGFEPARRAMGGAVVEVHMIDVGQGDAIAIRSPRGRWWLVDAGPRSLGYDAGAARVVPYLARRRVRDLAGIVVTHPHSDHIGGVGAVLEAFRVHTILEPTLPAPRPMYLASLGAVRAEEARWIAARYGTRITLDGMEMHVIYPLLRLDAHTDPNDYSAVILLRFGRFRALLLGDAPTAAEERMIARLGAELRAQVVKIGHHGSSTSTGDALLRAVQPRLALVSVGARNRYGHPAPDVLERLGRSNVAVFRTDERGAVVVRADARGRLRVGTER